MDRPHRRHSPAPAGASSGALVASSPMRRVHAADPPGRQMGVRSQATTHPRWRKSRDEPPSALRLVPQAKDSTRDRAEVTRLQAAPETVRDQDTAEPATGWNDRVRLATPPEWRLGTPMNEWKCKAQRTADPPQDCDWPFCCCDPHAQRVFEGIQESGKTIVNDNELAHLKDIIDRAIPSIGFHWSMTAGGPRKSNLLALRHEAEKVAATLEQGGP